MKTFLGQVLETYKAAVNPVGATKDLSANERDIAIIEKRLLKLAAQKRNKLRLSAWSVNNEVVEHFRDQGFVVWVNSEVVVISF